jgi:hypothetical protein
MTLKANGPVAKVALTTTGLAALTALAVGVPRAIRRGTGDDGTAGTAGQAGSPVPDDGGGCVPGPGNPCDAEV